MSVTVDIATEATPDLVETIGRILPQLSKSSPAPTTAEIAEIIDSPASDLLVARVDGRIVGTLTFKPNGLFGKQVVTRV